VYDWDHPHSSTDKTWIILNESMFEDSRGLHYVVVRAEDAFGNMDINLVEWSIEGLNEKPFADFSVSETVVSPFEIISFTDMSYDNDGSLVNWSWNFGDGNLSFEQDPVHTYSSTGSYDVCLTVIDNENSSDMFCVSISVISLGVDQDVFDRGFPVRHAADGDWAAAQSFLPVMDTITSIQIYLRKFGTPEFNLTVELHENHPQGTLLDNLVFNPDDVPSSWEWFTFDFEDTAILPGTDYFIVCPPAPGGVTTSFGYEWGYAFGNQYDDGAFWFTRDGGGLWRDLPTMYEFCFKTYGFF